MSGIRWIIFISYIYLFAIFSSFCFTEPLKTQPNLVSITRGSFPDLQLRVLKQIIRKSLNQWVNLYPQNQSSYQLDPNLTEVCNFG